MNSSSSNARDLPIGAFPRQAPDRPTQSLGAVAATVLMAREISARHAKTPATDAQELAKVPSTGFVRAYLKWRVAAGTLAVESGRSPAPRGQPPANAGQPF